MKKQLLLTILLFASCGVIFSQINLIGSGINPSSGKIDIIKWRALDSLSVMSYPTELDGYYYGSSVFNSYSSNYYLTGIISDASVLFSFNSITNQTSTSSYASFSNITQIDMSTGKIYNLVSDSADYFSIIEYDIATGTDIVLGTIYEPGIPGIITDATCFNSNEGILYYIGVDSTPGHTLYSIPVRNPVFTYSKTRLQYGSTFYNLSNVQYDNVNDLIFALSSKFDQNWNNTGNVIVEIDKTSGVVTERGELAGIQYFLGGSSSFDQNSGNFLLVGYDSAFSGGMIVFNTYSNTFQTGFVPGMVSEIVCDNSCFAQETYINTANKQDERAALKVYPNPASVKFTIEVEEIYDNYYYTLSSLDGRIILRGPILKKETIISTEKLLKGVYVVSIISNDNIETEKVVIQ